MRSGLLLHPLSATAATTAPFLRSPRITATFATLTRANSLPRMASSASFSIENDGGNTAPKVAIIGAGIAGLTCARTLLTSCPTARVSLFEKSTSHGRCATRTVPGIGSFDHGAPHFSALSPAFREQVQTWREAGLVVPLSPFTSSSDSTSAAATARYVVHPSMRTLPTHLAEGLAVHRPLLITKLEYVRKAQGQDASQEQSAPSSPPGHQGGWALHHDQGTVPEVFDAVVVAVPAEQSCALLSPVSPALTSLLAPVRSRPCLSVLVAWDGPTGAPWSEWTADMDGEDGCVGGDSHGASVWARSGVQPVPPGSLPPLSLDHSRLSPLLFPPTDFLSLSRIICTIPYSEPPSPPSALRTPLSILASARRDDLKTAGRPGREGGREGERVGELWVFHTTPEYSARYIQTEPFPREKVVSDVLRSFSGKFGSGEEGGGTRQGGGRKPAYVAVQRWLYSQTDNPARPSYGWEEGVRLGACGDGWEGGRDGGEGAEGVERAWLSGKGLGERIAASFTRKKR